MDAVAAGTQVVRVEARARPNHALVERNPRGQPRLVGQNVLYPSAPDGFALELGQQLVHSLA